MQLGVTALIVLIVWKKNREKMCCLY